MRVYSCKWRVVVGLNAMLEVRMAFKSQYIRVLESNNLNIILSISLV
jgi:hypothetical protein